MSALLGYTSERRRLRRVGRDFGHLFPYVPQQSGHNKRLRAAFSLLTSMIRIMAVCTLGGLPVLFALTGAKADERETLRDMLDTAPDVLAVHPGQTIIGDKNYFGREFEHGLAERHLKLLRPARKGKPSRPGHTCSNRCGRSSSRSIRPSRGSSTWNDTAPRALQGCQTRIRPPSMSCIRSSSRPGLVPDPRTHSGDLAQRPNWTAHQAITHGLRSLTATTPLGLIHLGRRLVRAGGDRARYLRRRRSRRRLPARPQAQARHLRP